MKWLKAKVFLILVGLLWLRLILCKPEIIILTLYGIFNKNKSYRLYLWGLWIADDQSVNATLGGNPDVTVSSKVGYLSNRDGQHAHRGSMTARAMEKVIDFGFKVTVNQDNHCIESYEPSEKHYSYFWRQ